MRFSQRILVAAVAATAILMSAGAVSARGLGGEANANAPDLHSYGGSWPVTITGSQFSNGTFCLTLDGNGNTGTATYVMGNQKFPYGSFVILNHILMATIVKPSGSQNGALTFTVPADRGRVGPGLYENIEGGSNADVGSLKFGVKGGC